MPSLFPYGEAGMSRIKPCSHCERGYDIYGGVASRGKHYAPYCSLYCREASTQGIPWKGSKSSPIIVDCAWCGEPQMELKHLHNHASRTTCSEKCRKESRRHHKEWYILLMLKLFGKEMSAAEIAREIQKVGGSVTARFTTGRVANIARRLSLRGAIIIEKDGHSPRTYRLADPKAPINKFVGNA